MIKIAVCDDVERISENLKFVIETRMANRNIEVDAFTDGRKMCEEAAKKRYDIILIDIELVPGHGETGMEASAKIKSIYPDVLIIFMTGIAGYERKLLSFEPFRFIRKPFTDEELIFILNKAVRRVEGWEINYFIFRDGGLGHRKDLNDIIFFRSSSPYIEIVCLRETARFRDRLEAVEEKLSAMSNDFLRPGKGFLVNRKYISSSSSKEITMVNGEKIPISRRYRKEFLAALDG